MREASSRGAQAQERPLECQKEQIADRDRGWQGNAKDE
jgi:hypothetical protein